MPIKKYRPLTPTLRYKQTLDFKKDLTTGNEPHKALTTGKSKAAGRNHAGLITMRRRGGGHKRKLRLIDFKRDKIGIEAVIETVEYDPNRSANIALVCYLDGERRYIVAPEGIKVGDRLVNREGAALEPGNVLPLSKIPVNTIIHNIELKPGKGGQIARSAGASAEIVAREGEYAQVKMPSGEIRRIHVECRAVIGRVGNGDHNRVVSGSAGRSRWLGKRPKVRGVAMNPVDHPMGGGEGKTSGGSHPVSPWGKKSKGKKTRNNKATDKFIVRRRQNKNKR